MFNGVTYLVLFFHILVLQEHTGIYVHFKETIILDTSDASVAFTGFSTELD